MIYSFGSFKLDTKKRQLFSTNDTVHIAVNVQPRVYQLLLLLISHREEALDKYTVQEAIWPNQILSETSLSRLVMKARKSLNDNPDDPQYIKTLHGFGFQFIADVLEFEDEPSKDARQNKLTTDEPFNNTSIPRNIPKWAFSVLAVISLAIISYFQFSPVSIDTTTERILILPVVNEIDDNEHAWISLGLPSLINTMLEQSGDVGTVNINHIKDFKFNKENEVLLANSQISELLERHSASKIVFSKLEKQGDLFSLSYSIHENTTQVPTYKISANAPSQVAKLLTEILLGSNQTAIDEALKYSISSNDFVSTLYGRGQSFLLQGHTQKARDIFKVAISEEPDLYWPRYSFALTSRRLGKWEQSEKELLKLLKHPNLNQINHAESRTRNVLGFTYYRLRQYDKALVQYKQAYQLSELDKDYKLQASIADNVGVIYWVRYEFDESRIWLTRAISKRKEAGLKLTGHAYHVLALLERDQGNLSASYDQFEKSSKIFGEAGMIRDYTMTQIDMSVIDEHLGRYKRGLTRLKESQGNFGKLKENEGLSFLHKRLTSMYLSISNLSLAEKNARKALAHAENLKSKVGIAETNFLLGLIYIASEEPDRAEPLLIKILPHTEEVWAPYVPFMKLAMLRNDEKQLTDYYSLAIKDSIDKDDRLSKLYADSIYQMGNPHFTNNDPEWDKLNTEIVNRARNLNAKKILGDHLVFLVEKEIAKKDYDGALSLFQQLDLVHPDWQITHSLKLILSIYQLDKNKYFSELQSFKNNHRETWSKKEEKWLQAITNK